MKKNKLLLLFLFPVYLLSAQNNDLFSFDNSIKYADYLYRNAEYNLAIQEYKRILFLDPGHDLYAYKLFDSYILSHEYGKGLNYYNQNILKLHQTDTLLLLKGKLLLLSSNINSFSGLLGYGGLSNQSKHFLNFSQLMFQTKWEEASEVLVGLNETNEYQEFVPIVNRALDIKYKSSALSLSMSAIVPGMGKMYCGYWKDGVFSLLFTGLSAWQAYRGFTQHGTSSFYSWFMGGLSLSFYVGNLYGSAKAANKRNHSYNHEIMDNFEDAFIHTYSDF